MFSLSHSPANKSLRENAGAGFVRAEASLPSTQAARTRSEYLLTANTRPCQLAQPGSGSGKFEYGDDKKIYLRMYEIVEILPSVCLHFFVCLASEREQKNPHVQVVSPQHTEVTLSQVTGFSVPTLDINP